MNSRHLHALGIPGFVGFGLILFCASFHFGTIAPMQAQLNSVKSEARKLTETLRNREPIEVPTARADGDTLPTGTKPAVDPIEISRRLNAAAEAAVVVVDHASYAITEKDGVRRIEVSLPTKGGYLPVRSYLREAMAVGRNAQIDSLVLQRARATDPVLDADLKLSFELEAK